MALFGGPLAAIRQFINRHERGGSLRRFAPVPVSDWSVSAPQVVLRRSTGLELGSSSGASLALALWEEGSDASGGDRILLVGPDLPEAGAGELPLALIMMARVQLAGEEDHYECHRELREAIYRVGIRGVMLRSLPSRQSIWCRVDRDALERGLNACLLGSAFAAALQGRSFVDGADLLLVTERQAIAELRGAADQVLDIIEPLTRMHEETMALDCDRCEYQEVCDAVDELRRIHTRLSTRRES